MCSVLFGTVLLDFSLATGIVSRIQPLPLSELTPAVRKSERGRGWLRETTTATGQCLSVSGTLSSRVGLGHPPHFFTFNRRLCTFCPSYLRSFFQLIVLTGSKTLCSRQKLSPEEMRSSGPWPETEITTSGDAAIQRRVWHFYSTDTKKMNMLYSMNIIKASCQ